MMIFVAIAVAAFFLVAGSFLFGHDHDVGHDVSDVSADHDAAHDDFAGDNEPTISIFSTKVIFTMIMGFGAAGAIARYYGANLALSSGIGVIFGFILGMVMYGILGLIYRQQANSSVSVSSLIGCRGSVTVSIDKNSVGQVSVMANGQYNVQPAISADGQAIPKMSDVKVVSISGGRLVVQAAAS